MEKTIRFGIMGTGGIARKFAQAVPQVKGAELVACASRTPGKGEAFAREFGVPKAYQTYEELLADGEVDCVYIATTSNFHRENLLSCLAAGKHVLCEKPMLSRYDQTREVFKEAEKAGVFVMEAMWSRFLPSIQEARRILHSGELGKLLHIECRFGIQTGPQQFKRGYNRKLEGSTATDMGIYNYDITTFLVGGVPDSVSTTPGVLHGQTDVECNALLHFPQDVTAYLLCGFRFPTSHELTAYCQEGRLLLTPYFVNPQRLELTWYDGRSKTLDFPCENGFEYEIQETVHCIREGLSQSQTHPWADTLESARFFDQMFASWGNPWSR